MYLYVQTKEIKTIYGRCCISLIGKKLFRIQYNFEVVIKAIFFFSLPDGKNFSHRVRIDASQKSTRSPIIASIGTREIEMTISLCITMHEECEILNLFQEKFFHRRLLESIARANAWLSKLCSGRLCCMEKYKQMDQSRSQVFWWIDCKI